MVLISTFQGLRGAQPDGLNAEYCVAVLNNIYKVKNCIIIPTSGIILYAYLSLPLIFLPGLPTTHPARLANT